MLVTGASGFVGGAVARRLAANGVTHVRAMVRASSRIERLRVPGIEIVRGDLLDVASLRAACEGADAIIHAAGCVTPVRRAVLWNTSVEGTRNLLAVMAPRVRRFVFVSSFAVYLNADHDENRLPRASGDLYGDSRIAAEAELRGHPRVSILRAPAIYGPGSAVWSERYLRLASRRRLFLPGRGAFSFAYVFVENLVDAILAAADDRTPPGIYNIVDGHLPYREFVAPYARAMHAPMRELPLWLLRPGVSIATWGARAFDIWFPLSPVFLRYLLSGRSGAASADRARTLLGWHPRVTFDEGIAMTLSHRQGAHEQMPMFQEPG